MKVLGSLLAVPVLNSTRLRVLDSTSVPAVLRLITASPVVVIDAILRDSADVTEQGTHKVIRLLCEVDDNR